MNSTRPMKPDAWLIATRSCRLLLRAAMIGNVGAAVASLAPRLASAETQAPLAIGGCRGITPDGHIIGSSTELEGTEIKQNRGGKVWFFTIKAE